MNTKDRKSALRRLPAVEKILKSDRAIPLIERHTRPFLVSALRKTLDALREEMSDFTKEWADVTDSAIESKIFERVELYLKPDLRRVINATGVIVHTNLGRAPLAEEAIAAMNEAARGYSNLEYDLEAGARGSRQSLIDAKLCELTGAEAAIIVNNNAGALMLSLMALAKGKEAIVSRGELVEIGGSFRIPDVMAASGAIMVEVGTTNKTHLKDYEKAANERTGALLKVHRSNFFIGGFTKDVSVNELSELAIRTGLPLIVDLGSGVLVDTVHYGLPHEPTPGEILKQGADLVTFSGDKLLGGPQAGIIAGNKDLVAQIKAHPVHRAMRPDKVTLAAMEATLRLYIQGREDEIPVISMIAAEVPALRKKAKSILGMLRPRLDAGGFKIDAMDSVARIGGGALADAELPSFVVTISHRQRSPEWIIGRLRDGEPPVIARIEREMVLLDMRTLHGVSEGEFVDAVARALS